MGHSDPSHIHGTEVPYMITITCLRHGKAVPGEIDDERDLSYEGIVEAKACRAALGHPNNITMVVHSHKKRTRDTATILTHRSHPEFVEVPELWFGVGEPEVEQKLSIAYETLRETGTLRQYRDLVGPTLDDCAMKAVSITYDVTKDHDRSNIFIVGHGPIFLPAFGRIVTGKDDPFMNMALKPCQGFQIIGENHSNMFIDRRAPVKIELIR